MALVTIAVIVILSFGDRETELIWSGIRVKKLPLEIQISGLMIHGELYSKWSEGQSEQVKIMDYH